MEDMRMGLMALPTVKSILHLVQVGFVVDIDPSLSMGPAMAVQWHQLRGNREIASQGPTWPPGRDIHGRNCSHKPLYGRTVHCLAGPFPADARVLAKNSRVL